MPKKSAKRVPEDKEILNAGEAATVLGISQRLLLRLARDGEVPGKKLGREWRFLRSALRASISEQGSADNDLIDALKKAGADFSISNPKKPKR